MRFELGGVAIDSPLYRRKIYYIWSHLPTCELDDVLTGGGGIVTNKEGNNILS